METLIKQIEVIPLSGEDLVSMANKMGNTHTKWMQYENLRTVKDLDSLFPAEGSPNHINTIFFLLQIRNDGPKPQIGHWISLIKTKPDEGERASMAEYIYADPYGLSINEDLMATGEEDYWTNLFRGRKIDVSKFKYQKFRADLNTCGRWAVERSIFHFMSNKQHDNIIIKPIRSMVNDLDVYVIFMTMFLSKSDDVVRTFFMEKSLKGGSIHYGNLFSRMGKGGAVV